MLKTGISLSQLSGSLAESHLDVPHIHFIVTFIDISRPKTGSIVDVLKKSIDLRWPSLLCPFEKVVSFVTNDSIYQLPDVSSIFETIFNVSTTAQRSQFGLDVPIYRLIALPVPVELGKDKGGGIDDLFVNLFKIFK